MIVETGMEETVTRIYQYDIDVDDYKEWLDDEDPSEDNLLNYIYEKDLEPINSWENNIDNNDMYVDNAEKLFSVIENE